MRAIITFILLFVITVAAKEFSFHKPYFLVKDQPMPPSIYINGLLEFSKNPWGEIIIDGNPIAVLNKPDILLSFGAGFVSRRLPVKKNTTLYSTFFKDTYISFFGAGKIVKNWFWMLYTNYGFYSNSYKVRKSKIDKYLLLTTIGWKIRPHFSLGLTSIFSTNYGNQPSFLFLPYGAFCYKRVNILLGPAPELKLIYDAHEKISLSLNGQLMKFNFYYTEPGEVLDYERIALSGTIKYHLLKFLYLEYGVSYSMRQNVKYQNNMNNKIEVKKQSIYNFFSIQFTVE